MAVHDTGAADDGPQAGLLNHLPCRQFFHQTIHEKAWRFIGPHPQVSGRPRVISGRPNFPIDVRQDVIPAASMNRTQPRQLPVGTNSHGSAQLDWLLRLLNILELLLHLLLSSPSIILACSPQLNAPTRGLRVACDLHATAQ